MSNFKVYQVDSDKEIEARENGKSYMFTSLDVHKMVGTKPEREMYKCIFDGNTDSINPEKFCENLYKLTNLTHVDGWNGHSMSVSDIVEINNEYYYCDDIGFVRLEEF